MRRALERLASRSRCAGDDMRAQADVAGWLIAEFDTTIDRLPQSFDRAATKAAAAAILARVADRSGRRTCARSVPDLRAGRSTADCRAAGDRVDEAARVGRVRRLRSRDRRSSAQAVAARPGPSSPRCGALDDRLRPSCWAARRSRDRSASEFSEDGDLDAAVTGLAASGSGLESVRTVSQPKSHYRRIPMARFKLFIEYAGTKYSGWQIQKNARTVQGELTRVIADVTGAEAIRAVRLRADRRGRARARAGRASRHHHRHSRRDAAPPDQRRAAERYPPPESRAGAAKVSRAA